MRYANCACPDCNNIGTVRIGLDKRGGRPAFLCEWHATHNECYGEGGKNNAGAFNKARAKMYRNGIEFETSWTSEKARIEFLGNNFTPTNDGSLEGEFTCEYVSPLYHGMNSLVRYVKTIDKYVKSGDIQMNDSCGTHFHMSLNNMVVEHGENVMRYLRNKEIYKRVFMPLSNILKENPEKCEMLFGRELNPNYANALSESFCDPRDRYNFINVTNNTNIEFRVFKFRDAKQYTKAMWFARDVVDSIMRNFSDFYQMDEDEILHKCDVVGKKICKKFNEYLTKLAEEE